MEHKTAIFGRTIGLAGALAYLHEELYMPSSNERYQCYHLDMKPQNILVFNIGGNDVWKISDFGISKMKKKTPDGHAHLESEHLLDKVFKPKKNIDSSSGIENARFGGTYAAPEAKEQSDMVTTKSDVWSLGCVIALVLTFMDSQSQGIHRFQKARQKGRNQDWFFDSETLKTRSDDNKILHASVSTWLDDLTTNASKRSTSEGMAIQKASEMLQEKLLIQSQRLSARELELELQIIQSHLTGSAPSLPKSDMPNQSRHHWHIPHPHLHLPHHYHASQRQHDWHFGIPVEARECAFGNDGTYLAIITNENIVIRSITDVHNDRMGTGHVPPHGKQWAHFSLGSKYMCAALDSDYFQVPLKFPRSKRHFC